MQKISWFSSLEEIDCMLDGYVDALPMPNVKINFVEYLWNKNNRDQKIQKIKMAEFL